MKKLRIIYAAAFLILLLAEVLIALFVHDSFIRPYFGDVLITILLCCFLRIFIPNKCPLLPIYVFLFATAVEISQYFDLVEQLGFSNNPFLSTLMGRSFSFWDLVCYAVGCAVFVLTELVGKKVIPGGGLS